MNQTLVSKAPVGVDFGPCDKCGQNNSHSVSRCHGCAEILPWTRARLDAQASKVAAKAAKKATKSDNAIALPRVDVGYWATGGFIFMVAMSMPVIGYGLTRYFDADESELGGFARSGLFTGVILWALCFVARMAAVGNMPSH